MKHLQRLVIIISITGLSSLACILTDAISPPGTLAQPTLVILPLLRLADAFYLPAEPIQVFFTAPISYTDDALVAVVRADTPRENGAAIAGEMHSYQFLEGKTSGVLDFNAPQSLGVYEFRMYGSENDNPEVASAAFKVTDMGAELYIPEATLTLDKKHYLLGEEISVFFTALEEFTVDPWVGIVPSSVTHGSEEKNRTNAIETQPLNGRTSGILVFTAPTYLDSYDLRMNVDGVEVAAVTFQVVEY